MEDFQNISLIFLADQMRLMEINPTARKVLDYTDSKKTIYEVTEQIQDELNVKSNSFRKDMLDLISTFIESGVLNTVVRLKYEGEFKMNETTKYMANPDVSCRIEDEDGAILFNPDNDSTQVVNPIGLDIWRSVEKLPRSLNEIVIHIKEIYEDAPEDQVEKDVENFILNLHSKGFIGEVVDE